MINRVKDDEIIISLPREVKEWLIQKSKKDTIKESELIYHILSDYVEEQKENADQEDDLVSNLIRVMRRF